MPQNKTQPTTIAVDTFLSGIEPKRRQEAVVLIGIMQQISGTTPVMWGPSIIGFGSHHYVYDTGREGDMPRIGFSPRKSAITLYFTEGFDRYSTLLQKLGKYKASVSCLYINKLEDINVDILRQMVQQSYALLSNPPSKPSTVDEYIAHVPTDSRAMFSELRALVKSKLPHAKEVLSYGIIGYKIDDKRARVFVSGWKDHVAMYPVPKAVALQAELAPYVKGKGTLWFPLNKPLPKALIEKIVQALTA